MLDFFGFESLDKNSFEQLNINYCNERIHQSYIHIVLKYQQELYVREGLEWTKIDFYDNQPICELMDKVCASSLSSVFCKLIFDDIPATVRDLFSHG